MWCIVVPLIYLQLAWYPPSQDLPDVIVVERAFASRRNKGSNTMHIVSDFQAAQSAAQSGNLSAYETAIAQEATDNNPVVQDFNEFGATVCAGGSSSSPSPSASSSPSPP